MKHLRIALLALTLIFSVAAIAAPKNDKTPKATKAHKTNKTTKAEITNKPAFTCYYFLVSNTVLKGGDCSTLILTYPTTVPLTTTSCSGPQTHFCAVGFPGYINVGTVSNPIYHPSDTPNGGTEITNYCNFSCAAYKP